MDTRIFRVVTGFSGYNRGNGIECSGGGGTPQSASHRLEVCVNPKDTPSDIPFGYCHCGCGQKTSIAKWSDATKGWVRGEPKRFIAEHTRFPRTDPVPRFWQRVARGEPEDCWTFRGVQQSSGHTRFFDGERMVPAHRFSWELHHGKIPDGLCICHRCDNPSCVNPSHLFLGTHADNSRDMVEKGRQRNGITTKLTEDQVRAIRFSPDLQGLARKDIAARLGVSCRTVSDIQRGVRWKHVLRAGKGN